MVRNATTKKTKQPIAQILEKQYFHNNQDACGCAGRGREAPQQRHLFTKSHEIYASLTVRNIFLALGPCVPIHGSDKTSLGAFCFLYGLFTTQNSPIVCCWCHE
jgi:hypothetical protein